MGRGIMRTGTFGTRRDNLKNVPVAGGWDTPPKGGVPSQPPVTTGAEVRDLARKVGRLLPNWHNPETFFEDRDELERALKRVARQIEVQGG